MAKGTKVPNVGSSIMILKSRKDHFRIYVALKKCCLEFINLIIIFFIKNIDLWLGIICTLNQYLLFILN